MALSFVKRVKDKWNQVNSPENVAAFNQKMRQSAMGGGMVGGSIKAVGPEAFETAVNVAKGGTLGGYGNATRTIHQAARETLSNAEFLKFMKRGGWTGPRAVSKIADRIMQRENTAIGRAVDKLPNLFRRK